MEVELFSQARRAALRGKEDLGWWRKRKILDGMVLFALTFRLSVVGTKDTVVTPTARGKGNDEIVSGVWVLLPDGSGHRNRELSCLSPMALVCGMR